MNEFLEYGEGGDLEYDGIKLQALKDKTPLFIFSQNKILKQYNNLKQKASMEFGNPVKISYDIKANETKAIIKLLYGQGCFFSLNKIEQLRKIIEVIDDDHVEKVIFYNNPLLEKEELIEVLSYGVKKFIVSGKENFELIRECVEEQEINVYLRIKTEVEIINDYSKREEVGFDLKEVEELFQGGMDNLKIKGFYNKLITQNTDIRSVEDNLKEISEGLLRFKFKDVQIEELFLNLGLPIGYEGEEDIDEIIEMVSAYIKEVKRDLKLEVNLECGRYIVGESGILLSKIKKVDGENLILDVSKYGFFSFNNIKFPVRCVNGEEKVNWYKLVGSTLFPDDGFHEAELPIVKKEDLIIFENVGAYCFSSDFLGMGKPRTVMVKK